MPRRRRGVALSDVLLAQRPFPPASCLDLRIRWNLPRGARVRKIVRSGRLGEMIPGATRAETTYVLRIERIVDKLEKTWANWPTALQFKFMFAIEQGVRAAAAYRLSAGLKPQANEVLRRAARVATSARRLERLGRLVEARARAREAVDLTEQAHLHAGLRDPRPVFAMMLDQVQREAIGGGLFFPSWSLIGCLFQLCGSGYADAPALGHKHRNLSAPTRRFGRTRFTFAIPSAAQVRALNEAERIIRTASNS